MVSCTQLGKSLAFCCIFLLAGTPADAARRHNKAAAPAAAAPVSATDGYDKLDTAYSRFSADFYSNLAHSGKQISYKSMERLSDAVQDLLRQDQSVSAVATIVHNTKLLSQHIDNPKIIDIMTVLLNQNELATATRLNNQIKEESGKALQANVAYLFAHYYFLRNNWNKTLASLEGITGDLPQLKYHHALLMQGIALQKLKQHRAALLLYEKIPATSPYYLSARVNMAVADIRQDWWTDAHIVINGLLARPDIRQQFDEADRLYTILGYSFLQQSYYRDARNAFRNVGLKGPYTNQALLGIALAAANQEDYIGALNGVRILKQNQSLDLPVDEAYLLMPYFYERLHQHSTASAGYSEAMQYYENRISAINSAKQLATADFVKKMSFMTDGTLSLQFNIIDLGDRVPPAFTADFQQLQRLQSFVAESASTKLQQHFTEVQTAYQHALHDVANSALNERIAFLTDYMNQSRYGIARLLDKNETAQK